MTRSTLHRICAFKPDTTYYLDRTSSSSSFSFSSVSFSPILETGKVSLLLFATQLIKLRLERTRALAPRPPACDASERQGEQVEVANCVILSLSVLAIWAFFRPLQSLCLIVRALRANDRNLCVSTTTRRNILGRQSKSTVCIAPHINIARQSSRAARTLLGRLPHWPTLMPAVRHLCAGGRPQQMAGAPMLNFIILIYIVASA